MSEIEITGVFENVLGMIYSAKQKAEYQVNSTIIDLYWSIGEYVSKQIDVNGWGKSTVKALSEYILSKEPGIRGYSSQNIWRMKQFYETYKDKPELSRLLRENTWSNNLHIGSEGNNSLWVFFYIPRKLRITYVQFFVLGIYFEKLSGYTDNIKRQNC